MEDVQGRRLRRHPLILGTALLMVSNAVGTTGRKDVPVRIRKTQPPLVMRQEDRVTYLIGTGPQSFKVPLTRPWEYGPGKDAPFTGERLGGIPGHFILFTNSYLSNPANVQGQCGANPDGEVFLHVVSLGANPRETLAAQVESCLLPDANAEVNWNARDGSLKLDYRGSKTKTYQVDAEGAVVQTR